MNGSLFKAITFDFWDTLYVIERSQEYLDRRISEFSAALLELGVEKDPEQIVDAFRQGWKEAHYHQRREGKEIMPWGHLEIILQQLQLDLGSTSKDRLYEVYTTFTKRNPPRLNDFAAEIMQNLYSRYKLAIICNTGATPGTILREIMARDHIIDYYDCLVFSDETGYAKPHSRIFQHTLEKLNSTPGESAHIGDDPLTDVAGAKRAGMTAIWLAGEEKKTHPEPDFHIQSLMDLQRIIGL